MVRSGRLTAADLGLGTLTYITPTATRRVFAILSGTTGTGAAGTSVIFSHVNTKMSVIKGAWGVNYIEKGTYPWNVGTIDGGTLYMNVKNIKKTRGLFLIIGTPDELLIV